MNHDVFDPRAESLYILASEEFPLRQISQGFGLYSGVYRSQIPIISTMSGNRTEATTLKHFSD